MFEAWGQTFEKSEPTYATQRADTCSDQSWDDCIDSPSYQLEAVGIIMLGKVTADKREDGHGIV